MAQRRLVSPKELLGTTLRFEDGTSPFIFRETALREASTDEPAVLVIQFRLAFLGSNPSLHAAFRRECVLHTPLFAGFPGFRSKLWCDDVGTGVYSGVYEWQSASLATEYAERMVALLAPFSESRNCPVPRDRTPPAERLPVRSTRATKGQRDRLVAVS